MAQDAREKLAERRPETALQALYRARAAQEDHDRRIDVQLTLKLGQVLFGVRRV